MSIAALRDRFPAKQRKLWEIDRILIEEPGDAGTRIAIDMRAGFSAGNRNMGAGTIRLGRKVRVTDALIAMTEYLGDANMGRLDVWGAQLTNANLEALLELPWFAGLHVLNLGANKLTKKGIDALMAHPVAAQLADLTLSYNKVGSALAKVSLPQLASLELVYCGLNDKALPKLGAAALPTLRRLVLAGAATHTTPAKLGESSPDPSYSAAALSAFAAAPLAAQLTALNLGSLTIDEHGARAIGDHFDSLSELDLSGARMTAEAVAALASGTGLKSLKKLVLNGCTLDPEAARGLGGLHVDRLELNNCRLGDDGAAALADSGATIKALLLKSNGIHARGVEALLGSALAPQLATLGLIGNPLGDDTAAVILASDRLTALRRLALNSTGLTDRVLPALTASPLLPQLEFLLLSNNRLSDAAASALAEATMPGLERLALAKNCLTNAGVQTVQRAFPSAKLFLGAQDITKLEPQIIGNAVMRFSENAALVKPRPEPVPASLREQYLQAWIEQDVDNRDWLYLLPKNDAGTYVVGAAHGPTERVVMSDPPVANGQPELAVSADGAHLGVKAFCDGAYVVRLEDGASVRVGDVLTHQKGGVVFCDGRMVVLDCDTEADVWEGRLDVYGRRDDGTWTREHSVGGFEVARDGIVSLAGQRMFAVTGRHGVFFAAVRGDQLRFLGQLRMDTVEVFDADGRPAVRVHRKYTYELANVDEVLDAAFAEGESPKTIDLPKAAWS